jgi:predicted NAD/FAD-binding protein
VAVIGGGAAGMGAAWRLQEVAEVTLFEAQNRLGGHTDTHAVMTGGRTYSLDSGFTVFNRQNYPSFSTWLDELGVPTQPADTSFSVRNPETGLEYGSRGFASLFCQRRNLVSPSFWRMLDDLRRFSRLDVGAESGSLGELAEREGFSRGFVRDYLVPLCGTVWSLPYAQVLALPAAHVTRFMAQHRLLSFGGRQDWRVISGGSQRYVQEFDARFSGTVRCGTPVRAVARQANGAQVTLDSGTERFDLVVLACHSDQALALLVDASALETEVLGAIRYRTNRVVVHSDIRVMPANRAAWCSWNAVAGEQAQATYWMNLLQSLGSREEFFVTLNPTEPLERVWGERSYEHPEFGAGARAAQARHAEINGERNTYFCGAYWGWGSHEDAFASGLEAAGLARKALSIAA